MMSTATWTRNRIGLLGALLLVLAVTTTSRAQFDFDAPESAFTASVDASTTAVAAGESFEVRLAIGVDSGAHVFKRMTDFEWASVGNATEGDVVFPKGHMVADLLSDDPDAMTESYEEDFVVRATFTAAGAPGETIRLVGEATYQGCVADLCEPPATVPVSLTVAIVGDGAAPDGNSSTTKVKEADTTTENGGTLFSEFGMLMGLLLYFIAGMGLSLTPCVYPIIPITFAVLGGRDQKSPMAALSASLIYVLGLALVYAAIGALVGLVGGQVRSYLQSIWVMGPLALLFVVFALSMFDIITIQTPPKFESKLRSFTSGKSGLIGAFVMGMVSGMIAGPCIAGPVAGLLTGIALQGEVLIGFLGMFSVGLGMGAVLVLVGMFAGVMPKAGGWMENVKKIFGFVMLGAAVFLVRTFIGESVYFVAEALLIVAAVVYMGLLDQLTSESSGRARFARVIGIIGLLVALTLFLRGVGFGTLPDETTSSETTTTETAPDQTEDDDEGPVDRGPVEDVGGFRLATTEELDALIARGDKPIVLDFWASWCVPCKELEHNVLTKPKVVEALKDFHALKIDFDAETELVKRYRLFGPPVSLFISRSGEVLDDLRHDGSDISPEEYMRRLAVAKGR